MAIISAISSFIKKPKCSFPVFSAKRYTIQLTPVQCSSLKCEGLRFRDLTRIAKSVVPKNLHYHSLFLPAFGN